MQSGQIKFLPDLVHLLAHDPDDLVERSLSQKKVGIDSRSELADVTCPNEELMTGNLGVRGSLAQRGDEKLRPAMHS